SYLTWAGTFYIQLKDLTPSLAFFLASAVMLVSIPVSPVAGRLISRYGTKRFLVVPPLSIAVSLAAVPFLSPPWLFVAVVALAASVPFLPPAVFTIPSVLLSPERAGLAFAVLFTCANVGFLAGPLAVGMVQDAYPSGVPSFLTMAAFAAAALVLGFTLKTK
ncbi:MAG: MFS transporter, partial [Candidatus Bathyarchaeia archaeon]